MAKKYLDSVVLTQGLNSMAQSVSKNFAFKKECIKDIKIAPAIPSDRTDPTDTTLVPCLVLTYADDKLVDKAGNTIDHVVNVELGELGVSIKEWVASTSYEVDDFVLHDNKLYKCIVANNSTTFIDTEWQMIGSDFKIEEYVSGTDYKVDDIVTYNQHIYKCVVEPQVDNTTFDKSEWILLGVDDREKKLLDALTIEELKEDAVDVNKVTGYKITFKNLDENGDPIESELLQTKDLFPKFVDDTVSLTDPKAAEKLLSAKKVLDLIAVATGTDMSLYAQRNELYYTHTTYTRCLSSDEGAKEVVSAITSADTQVLYDDVLLQIADITLGEYVVTGIAYDAPLFVEKEGSLYKDVLSQFTINTLKEDVSDPDLITGYDLLYRNKKLYSEANKETTDLDFSTLDLNLPTATDEEMALVYETIYNKVFNDPSYVEGDIQDPDMKALYDSIYKKVFG